MTPSEISEECASEIQEYVPPGDLNTYVPMMNLDLPTTNSSSNQGNISEKPEAYYLIGQAGRPERNPAGDELPQLPWSHPTSQLEDSDIYEEISDDIDGDDRNIIELDRNRPRKPKSRRNSGQASTGSWDTDLLLRQARQKMIARDRNTSTGDSGPSSEQDSVDGIQSTSWWVS